MLQSFSTFNFSEFSTFSKFQNIKVKAHIEYHNKSTQLKGSVPQTCPSVWRKFGNICKIARRTSAMKYIFNKIADMQICCTFVRIRIYYLYLILLVISYSAIADVGAGVTAAPRMFKHCKGPLVWILNIETLYFQTQIMYIFLFFVKIHCVHKLFFNIEWVILQGNH